jgi:hypothetical protein
MTPWECRRALSDRLKTKGEMPLTAADDPHRWGVLGVANGRVRAGARLIDAVFLLTSGDSDRDRHEQEAKKWLRNFAPNVPTRIVRSGRLQWAGSHRRSLNRPVKTIRPGVSISNGLNSTDHGTLGCFVSTQPKRSGDSKKEPKEEPLILSAGHVCASGGVAVGAADYDRVKRIYQPGWTAVAPDDHWVADLTETSPLGTPPHIDAALCGLRRIKGELTRKFSPRPKWIPWLATPVSPTVAISGDVQKLGAGSGLTTGGMIVLVDAELMLPVAQRDAGPVGGLHLNITGAFAIMNQADVPSATRRMIGHRLDFGSQPMDFETAVRGTKPFVTSSDSGAIVVDPEGRPIGMVVGVARGLVYCHPIQDLLDAFPGVGPLRIVAD